MKKIILLAIFAIFPFKFQNANVVDDVHFLSDDTIIMHGIDVSYYQGTIDWAKIDTTVSFVICKATEGITKIDPKFNYNWQNCPLIKGAYHFFRPQYSGIDQAKLFLSVALVDSGNIMPVIDVEMTKSWKDDPKKGAKNLTEMVEYIEKTIGITPIIYTSGHFWNLYVSPHYVDKCHIIWVADYRKIEEPKSPENTDWTIWQYSDKGTVSGIDGYVDKNICKNIESILIKERIIKTD